MLGKKSVLTLAVVAGMVALAFQPWRDASNGQEPKPVGDQLTTLRKERLEAAKKAYKAWVHNPSMGIAETYVVSVQWLQAELELATTKEHRIAAYAAHVQRMKDWRREAMGGLKGDPETHMDILLINSSQREAEYWLVKERLEKASR